MTRRALLPALALLALGCTQNAFLELQVELPESPAGGDPWYAQIQVRDAAGHPFDLPWMGSDDPRTVQLGDSRQWDCISVQSMDPSLDLNVRVRFCRSDDCSAFADGNPPERLYTLEHPFYIGRRTYYRIEVPAVPTCSGTGACAGGSPGVCADDRCGCSTDEECGAGYRCEPSAGCVFVVDRCSIEGCISGVSATFCSMETGLHFCERNPNISRDSTYMCSLPE